MRELAVRKVIGGKNSDLIFQFITEALVINAIAIALAFSIIQVIHSPMKLLLGFYIPDLSSMDFSTLIMFLLTFAMGVTFTGLYPAMVCSKQNPVKMLGQGVVKKRKNNFNISFTTLQFSVAISLIVVAYSVWKQIEFVLSKDIGLDLSQTLVINLPHVRDNSFNTQIESLVRELNSNAVVNELTISQSVPGDGLQQFIDLALNTLDAGVSIESNGGVDENFISFYKIKLLAGRSFLPDSPADSSSILVSLSTANRLGFKSAEEAIGQNVYLFKENRVKVIGVFEDYKLTPFLNEGYINYNGEPGLALTYKDFLMPGASFNKINRISLRVPLEKFSDVIPEIENKFLKYFPGKNFNWYFLDSVITGKYNQQLVARNQITLFSILAIAIACLGLLGLITNKAIEKTKEIGIRKVLGAEFYQIAVLLLSSTTKQLVVAAVIGVPVAIYFTNQYLQNFSEQVSLHWLHYSKPLVLLVIITVSTVGVVVWRAARANPVEALKHE